MGTIGIKREKQADLGQNVVENSESDSIASAESQNFMG